jgi:predicted amidohydrolase
LIKQSAEQAVELLIFPELSLTGYCPEYAAQMALSRDHAIILSLRELAKRYGITTVAGCAEKTDGKPFNSQLICYADGKLGCYRKTHLGEKEKQYFRAGDSLPVFRGKLPFGVLLCYDTHFPEASTTLALTGATMIVAPHASPYCAGLRKNLWDKYLPARAYDNRVYLACCNQTGSNGCGALFGGGAVVYTPEGTVLCEDYSGLESVLVADLSISAVERFRGDDNCFNKKYFLAHRRPELYEAERGGFSE